MLSKADQFMLGFITATCSHIFWPILPQLYWSLILVLIGVLNYFFISNRFFSGAILGLLCTLFSIHWHSQISYKDTELHQNYLMQAEVLRVQKTANQSAAYIEFLVKTEALGKTQFKVIKPKILVKWYQPDFIPKAGNKLQLFVKITDLASYANPGNHQAGKQQVRLTAKNVHRLAIVRKSPSNRLISEAITLRQSLVDEILSRDLQYGHWLVALGLGQKSELTSADWDVLQLTSTTHLFSISGLHLALVASYVVLVLKPIIGLFNYKLPNYVGQAVILRCLTVLAFCYLYLVLAGEQIPVTRAYLGLCIFFGYTVFKRQVLLDKLLIRVVFVLCLFYPLSLLSMSFWLSVGAVFLILMFTVTRPNQISEYDKSNLLTSIRLQWSFFLVGIPLSLLIWHTLPTSSLAANILLIPFVSILLLPCLLIAISGLIMGLDMHAVLIVCDFLMHICVTIMHKSSAYSYVEVPGVSFVFICLVIALLIIFLWQKARLFSACALACCLVLQNQSQSKPTSDTIVFFDVGHGNASYFRSAKTSLMFDTGRGNAEYALFTRQIKPYFQSQNVNKLDALLISHFDDDHAGGLPHIQATIEVEQVISPRNLCVQGKTLDFGTTKIRFLWPQTNKQADLNKDSCVAIVEHKHYKILFAGDIGKAQELEILKLYPNLKVDILVAPHHGSKSSSSRQFVQTTQPDVVVFSTSYPNHWNHPAPEVLKRYRDIGAKIIHLGKSGALEVTWVDNQLKLTTYREGMYNRWYYKQH